MFLDVKGSDYLGLINISLRTVRVIKLISKGSIDECILQLGQKKLKLEQDMTAAEQGKLIHMQRKCSCSRERS